jgi:hypothetical protein
LCYETFFLNYIEKNLNLFNSWLPQLFNILHVVHYKKKTITSNVFHMIQNKKLHVNQQQNQIIFRTMSPIFSSPILPKKIS